MRTDYLLSPLILLMFCEGLAKGNWVIKPNVITIIVNMNRYVFNFRRYTEYIGK